MNLARAPMRELRVNDPVWVDRGGGWDSKPDGFLIPGILREIRYDDNRTPYGVVYLLQTVPAPPNAEGVAWIDKHTTWTTWLDFCRYRHHLYKF